MRIAIIHDWIDTYRGGERVLEALAELYPNAPIYTLFYAPEKLPKGVRERFEKRDIRVVAGVNRFRRLRKLLLPFLPTYIESIDLNEYDLILSSSSCVAKGVIAAPDAKHICYIHSPMRYVWDQRHEYFRGMGKIPFLSFFFNLIANYLRIWDFASSSRVDQFIANSCFVRERIRKYYGRSAVVVPPPVEIERFLNHVPGAKIDSEDYFLVAGAFVQYKRFDLAIKACEEIGHRLIVAGSGPLEKRLRQIALGNTSFEIAPSAERWADLLANCKALIFPGIEDFGIVPIEAMACGKPVIAYGVGGALDYVEPLVSGVFFKSQDVATLAGTLRGFRSETFDKSIIRQSIKKYKKEEFIKAISTQIEQVIGVQKV
ncbi:MAG: glycosyltransferase [Bdellovibrionota bacterium]